MESKFWRLVGLLLVRAGERILRHGPPPVVRHVGEEIRKEWRDHIWGGTDE